MEETIFINLSDINPIISESNGFKSLFDGVFRKLPQPSVSPPEIMCKLPISEETEENDSLQIPKKYNFENFEELFLNSQESLKKIQKNKELFEEENKKLQELFKKNFEEVLNKLRFWDINPLPYEVLKYFFENKEHIINLDEDLVKYFEEINIIIKTKKDDLRYEAARIGSLNLFKIIHGVFRKLQTPAAPRRACPECGAAENGYTWNTYTCICVARNGYLECLKYLHENGCPWNEELCEKAAENGHLDCLRYAYENGCPWDEVTCSGAASSGQLDCLRYAHENGCPWSSNTCYLAAQNGHLDCLRYAHEHGCPWCSNTCESAASNGHLDCLRYAHEHGCPWYESTCRNASANGHLDCLRYAHEHGCPWDKLTYEWAKNDEIYDYLEGKNFPIN